jgi:uncharacterized protein (TIGR03790 family)
MLSAGKKFCCALIILSIHFFGATAHALIKPEAIAIVVNTESQPSVQLGRLYAKLRKVPASHIIHIKGTDKEWISRNNFYEKIESPVKSAVTKLIDEGVNLRCLVTTYGVPLKVGIKKPPASRNPEIERLKKLLDEKKAEKERLQNKWFRKPRDKIKELGNEISSLRMKYWNISGSNTAAAVDSELALVLWPSYELEWGVPNPQALMNSGQKNLKKGKVLMVSRLDGPSPELAEELFRTAIEVERTGLRGKVYIDARGKKGADAYSRFDDDLRKTADILRKSTMYVKLDNRPELFDEGDAPEVAVYAGWYSHKEYVEGPEWVKGAFGYHIASSEAASLRDPKKNYWVKSMIERGVIASIGPVSEPFLHTFPLPSQFLPLFMSGQYSLAEVFALTNPFLSWRMILVGDPLYNPFKNRPAMVLENAPPAPE